MSKPLNSGEDGLSRRAPGFQKSSSKSESNSSNLAKEENLEEEINEEQVKKLANFIKGKLDSDEKSLRTELNQKQVEELFEFLNSPKPTPPAPSPSVSPQPIPSPQTRQIQEVPIQNLEDLNQSPQASSSQPPQRNQEEASYSYESQQGPALEYVRRYTQGEIVSFHTLEDDPQNLFSQAHALSSSRINTNKLAQRDIVKQNPGITEAKEKEYQGKQKKIYPWEA